MLDAYGIALQDAVASHQEEPAVRISSSSYQHQPLCGSARQDLAAYDHQRVQADGNHEQLGLDTLARLPESLRQ